MKKIRINNLIVFLISLTITLAISLSTLFTKNNILKNWYLYGIPIWIVIFVIFLVFSLVIFIYLLIYIKNFLFKKYTNDLDEELKNNLIFKYENKFLEKIITVILFIELILERITHKNIEKNFINDLYLTNKYIVIVSNCSKLTILEYKDINKILCYLSGNSMCVSVLGKNNKSYLLLCVPSNNDKLKDVKNNLINLILNKNNNIINCIDSYNNEKK